MEPTWSTLWLCLALWAATTRCSTATCSNSTSVAFTVNHVKNSTLHWSTEVKFDGNSNADNKWRIEIDQLNSFQCAGTMKFTATMDGSPSTGAATGNNLAAEVKHQVSVPTPRVVPGYTYVPGLGYYKMHEPGVNWEGARRMCVREGGHLAIVNSEQEAAALQLMFARTRKSFAFIGFHDPYTEGQFLTIYDVPIAEAGFDRFAPGQPDNVGANGENCGSIFRGDGGLNDIDCVSDTWPFICEQEL